MSGFFSHNCIKYLTANLTAIDVCLTAGVIQ